MSEKKEWLIDVPVLCIFFVRDDCFAQSFEAVRKARPSKLLLWQDGPRNEKDMEGIMKCREIAENIDWDCEVFRCYNEKNYGCDPSTFYSHKWAFSLVDKCIILEDDAVPSQSFFRFCKELLDKYENDTRINKICGMNQVKGFECPDSYFFASTGTLGWATWKRVADTWEENYEFLKDEYHMKNLLAGRQRKSQQKYHQTCLEHQSHGYPHWETIGTYSRLLNSQLCILPKVNLIKNVGLTENSTHSNITFESLSKVEQEVFYCDSEELEFPLKHPKYVVENTLYRQAKFDLIGEKNVFVTITRRIKKILRRLVKGDAKGVIKSVKRKLKIK
ncbi:MAG: hemolysin activation protein [Clostridia bacterium]|nr:hemolysin activation protein [Clostridia bacterium]